MPMRSIRLRLLAFAMIGTLLALAVAGAGLVALFSRHVERRAAQELDNTIAAIAGAIAFDAAGRLVLPREPGDPAYRTPLSGRYWQAGEVDAGAPLRSVSLWDEALPLAETPLTPGATETVRTLTESGQPIIRRETTVVLSHDGAERRVRIAAALAMAELEALRRGFARDLMPALAAFGLVVLVAAWLQVGAGLRPLAGVRRGVQRIRTGTAPRLDAAVPSEVSPLVEEINALLDLRDREAERARNRAADLAHGLKTPLTALLADAARLQGGDAAVAGNIAEAAGQMRRAVERELARARARPQTVASGVAIRPVAEAVARTLARTQAGEGIAMHIDVPSQAMAAVDADDLHDLLGNLMENGVRAARSALRVSVSVGAREVLIEIADDGAGPPPQEMHRLAARGARLDESGAGAGLGLAIVSDILAAYGDEPAFARGADGGLVVSFRLPAVGMPGSVIAPPRP